MLENSTLDTCLNSCRNKTYGIHESVVGKQFTGKFQDWQ